MTTRPTSPVVRDEVADSTPAWDPPVTPPEGAPNIVLIVLDDTGFAHLGCFGSDIDTSSIDRLAAEGLRYNNFHTTALCSPTRACLLTGRNHHSVGMRFLSNSDLGFSNARGVISPRAATMAEILSDAGYGTYALGKWHLANLEHVTPAGPFGNWPLQRGFHRFHGFLGGATDQFSPELTIDNHQVDPPNDPGYHLSADLADQAIGMITAHVSATARPFFVYLAFGATHTPHQAPQSVIEKYRGRYDDGWDAVRARWFACQKELGIVPADAELAPRNPGVRAWEDVPADEQRLSARFQEVFAAYLDHADKQIGRVLDHLDRIGQSENTIVMVVSDNGASQEGGEHGTMSTLATFNRLPEPIEDMVARLDELGGPLHFPNYPRGWAQVGNTPLAYYKGTTYEGGVRDPFVVRWPRRITDAGAIRTQYHHAVDVLPTLLDCAGLEAPAVRRGVEQLPVHGVSMAYTFDTATAGDRRTTQYYEMMGSRAIYHEGWKAVAKHEQGDRFEHDSWQLFHVDTDFSEVHDLAEAHPAKLRELQQVWWREAGRYDVTPLDDRKGELFAVRRPGGEMARRVFRFLPGIPHLDRFAIPDVRDRSFRISARIVVASDTSGALVACGSRPGGHVLYVDGGRLHFTSSYLGTPSTVTSAVPLPVGEHEVAAVFTKAAPNAGTLHLEIDGVPCGSMPMRTLPWRQTLYGMDIGADRGLTVSAAYEPPFEFHGVLHVVEYHLGDDRDDGSSRVRRRAERIDAENELAAQ